MSRFIKIGADGKALPGDATSWVAVHDTTLHLLWSKDDVCKQTDWDTAAEACAGLTLAGANDWRLPTVDELFALADRTRRSPAIDTAFFPGCANDWYWSSSAAAYAPESGAWVVYFNNGGAYWCYRDDHACVRAVRAVGVPPSQ